MGYLPGSPSIWDTFPKATFMGIPFPIESSSIDGGMRDHVHEYPHTPGGAPEKLGRRLYTFKCLANFDTNFEAYPGLYPNDLGTLIAAFESGTTGDLRFPQMRTTVPCYALNWNRQMTAKIRSGEKIDLTFREDASADFLFADLVSDGTDAIEYAATSIPASITGLNLSTPTLSLFDSLTTAVNFLLSFKDQAILYDARLGAAVAQVQNLCGQIDGQNDMQTVASYQAVENLHEVWAAAQKMSQDLLATGVPLLTYINPTTQGVNGIAIQLYGDTSRVGDLLSLNPFTNNAQVKAGTPVLYYPASVPPVTA